jgi:hypothetical protein
MLPFEQTAMLSIHLMQVLIHVSSYLRSARGLSPGFSFRPVRKYSKTRVAPFGIALGIRGQYQRPRTGPFRSRVMVSGPFRYLAVLPLVFAGGRTGTKEAVYVFISRRKTGEFHAPPKGKTNLTSRRASFSDGPGLQGKGSRASAGSRVRPVIAQG